MRGQELARLRFDRGLTQVELAETLGISRRYVYELESGKPTLFASRLFEVLRELGAHLEVVGRDEAGARTSRSAPRTPPVGEPPVGEVRE